MSSHKPYNENFDILDTIGEGAVGRVLLAYDKRVERNVAIKELKTDRPEGISDRIITRFLREAKITGQLEHPGIIPVYELDYKQDGTPFYAMKNVQGMTFHDILRACKGENEEESFKMRISLLDKFITICEALAYAHSKGIVHRDLKLGNIILGEFGEVAIIDWGLAKLYMTDGEEDSTPSSHITITEEDSLKTIDGAILGTPSFMAPEQIDKKFGKISPKTDVYSLGVILFTILTGKRPYREKGDAVLQKIVDNKPSPSAKERLSLIPPPLSAICSKAMSKEPNQRFESAADLAGELKAFRDGRLVSVYAYTKKELFKRFVAKNKVVLLALFGVIAAIIVGSAFSVDFAIKAHRARSMAENALINVTGLSQSAVSMARDFTEKIVRHFANYPSKKLSAELKNISSVLPAVLGLDPVKSPYQIWIMKNDGTIVYDEDPKQIGLNLFTARLYQNFPELLAFGDSIRSEPWGVGYYSFYGKDGKIIYKIGAWNVIPLKDRTAKFIITYPYSR